MFGEHPLRVLHVIDSLAEGGAEQNLLTLIRHLPPPAYEHHLAWLYADDRLLPAFSPHVASAFSVGAGRWLGLLAASHRLAKHMRRLRPDVVSAKLIRAQLAARMAAGLAGGIPSVSTWECVSYTADMYDLGWRGPWLRRLTWVLDVGTGLRDSRFIAVSRQVAEHNGRVLRVDPQRVTVVYNAVDLDRVVDLGAVERDGLRRDLGVDAGGPLLLSVGRLVSHKDHATSIEAMARVVASFPHAMLAIAGEGPLRPVLQTRIDTTRLGEHVRLLGARTDVPALLRAADLFVFPSRYEGLGIALMEALAAGLPTVSSRIPTTLEVADGTTAVRYFTPGDAGALATALIDALEDLPAFTASARASARGICERFAPEVMAKQYDAIFRSAAGGRGAPADPSVAGA